MSRAATFNSDYQSLSYLGNCPSPSIERIYAIYGLANGSEIIDLGSRDSDLDGYEKNHKSFSVVDFVTFLQSTNAIKEP